MVNGLKFCGVPEGMLAAARAKQLVYKWKKKRKLKWFIADRLPSFTKETYTKNVKAIFDSIQAVCGLAFSQTLDADEADFIQLTRAIDGVNGTLAEHELPNGSDTRLRGWWDLGDRWTAKRPVPQGSVYWPAVGRHEILHGCGLDHYNKIKTLMNAYYDENIFDIGPWEKQQLLDRYGDPIEAVEPPKPEDPKKGRELQVTLDGVRFKSVLVFPE
jgi:hypothetical protein